METKLKIRAENWAEIKAKLKQTFAKLTDDDLFFEEGKETELLERLEKKLGKTIQEISYMIDDYQSDYYLIR